MPAFHVQKGKTMTDSDTMIFVAMAVLGGFVLGWLACEAYILNRKGKR